MLSYSVQYGKFQFALWPEALQEILPGGVLQVTVYLQVYILLSKLAEFFIFPGGFSEGLSLPPST